mmetsp:Transcript_22884/g.56486  ORF Transcript_22884/g.56486 Transcript_22884/m.56486 type:complete len:247 (-) Transcript_22884:209-949(-)
MGSDRNVLTIVSRENMFPGVIFSPRAFLSDITRLAYTLLRAEKRAEKMAPHRPIHVNESSFRAANATPKMMGSRNRYVQIENVCFSRTIDSRAVKTGSLALTTWVKLTAPAANESCPVTWLPMCMRAWGTMATQKTSQDMSLGSLRMPVPHSVTNHTQLTSIWMADTVHGRLTMLSVLLFSTLAIVLKKYQPHINSAVYAVDSHPVVVSIPALPLLDRSRMFVCDADAGGRSAVTSSRVPAPPKVQ